jgi:ABC-type sugar transport system ATPase subunit
MSDAPAVEMRGIEKGFNGTPVLRGVDFTLAPGEVHALAGGNGAGKSTLMKILQGVHRPDAGTIRVGGQEVALHSASAAAAAGIGMVFQEFSLVPTLSVARNIFLNHEPRRYGLIDDRAMLRRAGEILAGTGVELDPATPLHTLPTGYWQLTEIAIVLLRKPSSARTGSCTAARRPRRRPRPGCRCFPRRNRCRWRSRASRGDDVRDRRRPGRAPRGQRGLSRGPRVRGPRR